MLSDIVHNACGFTFAPISHSFGNNGVLLKAQAGKLFRASSGVTQCSSIAVRLGQVAQWSWALACPAKYSEFKSGGFPE